MWEYAKDTALPKMKRKKCEMAYSRTEQEDAGEHLRSSIQLTLQGQLLTRHGLVPVDASLSKVLPLKVTRTADPAAVTHRRELEVEGNQRSKEQCSHSGSPGPGLCMLVLRSPHEFCLGHDDYEFSQQAYKGSLFWERKLLDRLRIVCVIRPCRGNCTAWTADIVSCSDAFAAESQRPDCSSKGTATLQHCRHVM